MRKLVNQNLRCGLSRSFRLVKLCVILMCLSFGVLSASSAYNQNTLLSVNAKNRSLKQVINDIEKQSEYIFFYNDDAIDANRRVNLSLSGVTIFTLLDSVLDRSFTGYEVNDRQVVLYRNASTSSGGSSSKVSPAPQQARTVVTGKVTDSKGSPVAAAAVVERGTTRGVVTGVDGTYSVEVSGPGAVLVYTYLGYETVEVPVGNQRVVNVTMESSSEEIDEVVVVAYGTQRKSSMTGSITSLKENELKTVTTSDVGTLLQGKVAGVVTTMTTGKPDGKSVIRIRGNGSIGTTKDPLWVVDGVIDAMGANINPNDIESMSILKDASATALYGSRASNGVIIVTTKNAKLGVNKIDVSAKLGFTTLSRGHLEMMNSEELYDYTAQALKNAKKYDMSWFTPALKENNTDWWDMVTQTALSQNYNISYSTGTEKIRSFTSADYFGEEGTVKGYSYERFTIRNNNDYKYNDRLTIKTKISGHYGNSSDKGLGLGPTYLYLPWDTPYDSKGELKTGKEGNDFAAGGDPRDYWFGRDKSNYLYNNKKGYYWSRNKNFGVNATLGFDYKIFDFLTFESTNNIILSQSRSESYVDPLNTGTGSDNGSIYNSSVYTRKRYFNQLLRFHYTFNEKHVLDAFAGFEYYDYFYHYHSGTGKGIPAGSQVLGVAASPKNINGDKYENKSQAFYFNANYSYDQRYMLQFSLRNDGSSKFGRDNRYGTFFTVGGAWNAHNESFMKGASWLDMLKLRASFGSVGNTPGVSYAHMGLYQLNRNYDGLPAAFPYQMANRKLTWEGTYTTNIGIDARIFDRLGIVLDFYIKNTSKLLYNAPLSVLSGYSYQWMNVGKMKNTGFEVTLAPELIKGRDWKWDMDINVAYNKNKIKELYKGEDQISGNHILREGYDASSWYLKEWAGVDPESGSPLWYNVKDGKKTLTGDINSATPVLSGVAAPKVTGGFTSNLSYKNVTLTVMCTYAFGHKIYHVSRENYDNDGVEIQYNTMKLHKGWKRWEKPGDIASHPKAIWGGNRDANKPSTRYLEDGDYFKIKSVMLTYALPAKWLKKIGFKGASVYVSGENLLTFTRFSGIDPEVSTGDASDATTGGAGNYTLSAYPVPRRVSFGINFSF